jgi:hypothetical protein
MDLSKYTLEQLKALAYENIISIQKYQNGLRVIEEEIAKRDETKPE